MAIRKENTDLNLNLATYREKVLGCWTGKNIGGTLGAPFEGPPVVHDIQFYTQDLNGEPAPNDDLDLQLVWLQAVEENGVFHLTPNLLGEYWLDLITGPWCEYSVCKANIKRGFYPPLSGACNNERWKISNGAWIRSEIWACIFPGQPDKAAFYASYDACADHSSDGIYAEMFTAALEAAAFVVTDVRQLIDIGLSKIPPDCRIAKNVTLVCECYDSGKTWLEAREAVSKAVEDIGWFQAPADLAVVIIGLLYGEGDFGKTLCTAVNCGSDTDCTAATCGAILGILNGRAGIPAKWIEPIGDGIQTVAINPFPFNLKLPKTLNELTDRVMNAALAAASECPSLLRLTQEPQHLSGDYLAQLTSGDYLAERVWNQPEYAMTFELPYGKLLLTYPDSPIVTPGEPCRLKMTFLSKRYESDLISAKWRLPDGWSMTPGYAFSIRKYAASLECTVIPGDFQDAFAYIPLDLLLNGRYNPVTLNIPFQLKGSTVHNTEEYPKIMQDELDRIRLKQKV